MENNNRLLEGFWTEEDIDHELNSQFMTFKDRKQLYNFDGVLKQIRAYHGDPEFEKQMGEFLDNYMKLPLGDIEPF